MTKKNLEQLVEETPFPVPNNKTLLVKTLDVLYGQKNAIICGIFLSYLGNKVYHSYNGQENMLGDMIKEGISYFSNGHKFNFREISSELLPSYLLKSGIGIIKELSILLGIMAGPFIGLELMHAATEHSRIPYDNKIPKKIVSPNRLRFTDKLKSYKYLIKGAAYQLVPLLRNPLKAKINYDKAIKYNEQNHYALAALANLHAEHYIKDKDNYEDLVKSFYNLFNHMTTHPIPQLIADRNIILMKKIESIVKYKGQNNIKSQEYIAHNLELAVINIYLRNNKEAIEYLDDAIDFNSMISFEDMHKIIINDNDSDVMQQMLEKDQKSSQLLCLYAIGMDAIAKNSLVYSNLAVEKSRWAFMQMFKKALQDKRTSKSPLGESKNLTYVFSNTSFIEDEVVFKESKDKVSLEEEIKLTHQINDIGKWHSNYQTPTPIGIEKYTINGEDRYVYIMRRCKGQTLQQLMEKAEKGEYSKNSLHKHITDIIDYLALIHGKMQVNEEKTNYLERVRKNLSSQNLDQGLIDKITDNYAPMLETINKSHKVYSKDAHAANWLISEEGQIVSIDNEFMNCATPQADLVKLFEIFPGINDSIKNQSLERYARKTGLNEKDLLLGYYNELISFTFRTSGSPVSWANNKEIKLRMIKSSIIAIEHIKNEFDEYYKKYGTNYDSLKECLKIMEKL